VAPSNETEKAIINFDEYTRLLKLLDEKKSKKISKPSFHYPYRAQTQDDDTIDVPFRFEDQ
jgi:hypothetical protein